MDGDVVIDQFQEIEIVYTSGTSGGASLPASSYSAAAVDEDTASAMPNINTYEEKLKKVPSSGSNSTPRPAAKTPRSSNVSENANSGMNSKQTSGTKMNASKTNNDNGKPKSEEPKVAEDISRRLVEYFVVVSSVPKVKKNDATEKKPPKKETKAKPTSEEIPHQSSQMAARIDARRAHLDNRGGGGATDASEKYEDQSSTASVRTNGPSADRPELPPSPAMESLTVDTLGLLEPFPAEKKSIRNLQEVDRMIGEQCAEIGDSMFSDDKSATSAASATQKMKNGFFRGMNSMREEGKKLSADASKLNTTGMKNLEKKLETLKLDKTLAKLKSIKSLTPMSSTREEKEYGETGGADDPDSSVGSSFESLDGATPDANGSASSCHSSGASTFQPSSAPTSARTTPPAPPSKPLSPTPPPLPPAKPPIKSVSTKPERSTTRQISPLPDRANTPLGASGNIRMGHEDDARNREFNNDIGDCILEPVITAQYPPVDHPDQPLTPMLPQFCHPQGTDQILPLQEYKMPKVHHFVLTDANGGKLYGTCLTVYEEFSPHSEIEIESGEEEDWNSSREEGHERGFVECSVNETPIAGRLRRRSKSHKYYAPRVLCLLSTWPYLSAFQTYLTQLYRLATTTNLMTAPLERYVQNICAEVPAPPPGSFEVKLSILGKNIRFWAPPADQPIPYVSLPYGVIFECLDIGNVLFAWYTLACERNILLVSSQQSLLTICAEILSSMLFPLRWSHLYIPCLPRFLTPMLDAPMPYLCGISRENFPHAVGDISDETVVVDLDRNVITMGKQTPNLPVLPRRRKLKLEAALEKHAGDVFWRARGLSKSEVEQARLSGDEDLLAKMLGMADAVWDERMGVMDEAFTLAHGPNSMSLLYSEDETALDRQSRWDAVQEGFLRFYVTMLKDYRRYMPSMPTDNRSDWRGSDAVDGGRFLAEEFVQSQLPDFQPFLEELIGTQQFDDFVTRRMYNAGDAPDVKFFDQSIDAKRNRSKLKLKKKETPFLHSANAHRDVKQIDAIQPNRSELPARSRFDVRYDMKKGQYTYPTWPESFDESLYGKPRPIPRIITAEFDRRSALTAMLRAKHGMGEEGRLSGSNNPSPEATAFVLFFVVFTHTIGKEWTLLEKEQALMDVNMLDQFLDDASVDSSIPEDMWKAKTNPEWMARENFESLHSTLRPSKKPEPHEDIVLDDTPTDGFFISDCNNFCTEVGKVIDPATFIGNPWARVQNSSIPHESGIQSNAEFSISPSDEERENEIEKARSIAKAQIDLGFNTLKMMRMRKLPSESITYKSLIEACGRCGIAHRAQQLMEMMTQDGISMDSEVYFAFIKAFSNAENEEIPSFSRESDSVSDFSANKSAPSVASSSFSFLNSTQGDEKSVKSSMRSNSTKFMDGFQNAMSSTVAANRRAFKTAKMKRTKRLSKRSLTKRKNLCLTDAIETQLELGSCILEDLYPGIKVDTRSDTCPKCSCVLGQDNTILGWKPCQVKDFTTTCPSCKHRFVPKFSVSCNLGSFEGSQGMGTPLYCDYLSPWVLLREIRSLITPSVSGKAVKILGVESDDIEQVGIDGIIDPKFREGNGINATLWWNMIVTFSRFRLPYTFLLQGSYEDQQLIMPTMTDTM